MAGPERCSPDMVGVVEASGLEKSAHMEEDCFAMLVIELPFLSVAD